ncbi:MAG: TetR/AcrR family transcriptional regulator [Alcanivoracaceae bacterium]|jgi:AcrR family transcriptional regulator|nr:TetR/AcrR family transcriptional regulator [Alcanivoracaceae bacterium]
MTESLMAEHNNYHHGDLRAALLQGAGELLREGGIEGLSLRKLAEQVGVSRTAPYHHFRDKHDLLCALAARGFSHLETLIEQAQLDRQGDLEAGLRAFVRAYLNFAAEHPETYDLMFGRTIWKSGQPTEELRDVAFRSFRRYVERIGTLVDQARLPAGSQPLRLAQASWATLHGLCRLLIDGIYVNRREMEEVSEESVRLMMALLARPG